MTICHGKISITNIAPNAPDCCQLGSFCEGIFLKHTPLFWGGGHTAGTILAHAIIRIQLPRVLDYPIIGILDFNNGGDYYYHAICVYSVTIYGNERNMCYTVFYNDPWFGEPRWEINNSPDGYEFSKIYILDY